MYWTWIRIWFLFRIQFVQGGSRIRIRKLKWMLSIGFVIGFVSGVFWRLELLGAHNSSILFTSIPLLKDSIFSIPLALRTKSWVFQQLQEFTLGFSTSIKNKILGIPLLPLTSYSSGYSPILNNLFLVIPLALGIKSLVFHEPQ